jgi:hypothetical protein
MSVENLDIVFMVLDYVNCKSKAFNFAFSGLDIIPYRIYKYNDEDEKGIF